MTTTQPTQRQSFVRRVDVMNWALSVVVVIGAVWTQPADIWRGVLAGAMVATVNFRVLAALVSRFISGGVTNQSVAVAALMFKMLVLAAFLLVVLLLLKPDPVAMIVGLSVAPLSLLVVGLIAPHNTDSPSSEVPS